MNISTHRYVDRFRSLVTGFLALLASIHLIHLFAEPYLFISAVLLIVCAVFLARKTAHHFHHGHHHAGDSALDVVAIGMLMLANILHPAIDGFSSYQVFSEEGVLAGVIVAGSIVLHEIIRQYALITAFKTMHIAWYWIISTALFGIAAGVYAGKMGSLVFAEFDRIADIATVFAYSFIIAEFHFAHPQERKKTQFYFFAIGVAIGLFVSIFLKG